MHSILRYIELVGLPERSWEILEMRVNEDMTLAEIGEQINLTRERVRQVQKIAVKRLKAKLLQLDLLLNTIEAEDLWTLFQDPISIDEAIGHCQAILTKNSWEDITTKSVRRLLIIPRILMSTNDNTLDKRWPLTSLAACFVHPIVKEHPKIQRWIYEEEERNRKWNYTQLIQMVLRNEAKPLHWQDIINHARELGHRHDFNNRALHNELVRQNNIFVRVGQGTYGLAEWGLESVDSYTNIIAEVLKETGKPLTFGQILHGVNSLRPILKVSLQLFLDTHPRFYESVENCYGLRAWLPKREFQTLRTPAWQIETSKSFLRVEKSREKGYNIDRIIMEDKES